MVFVGDLQIQINFTQKNQYRARMVAAPLILGGGGPKNFRPK